MCLPRIASPVPKGPEEISWLAYLCHLSDPGRFPLKEPTRLTNPLTVGLSTWLPGICVGSFQKAPGYVSRENRSTHSGKVFSPNGSEVYWAAKPTGGNLFHIYFMKLVDGHWTAPAITSFTERHEGNRPAFTPDGQRLNYETIRNPAGGPTLFVEREADGWSEPTALPGTINATGGARPYWVATDRSLHFGRGLLRDDEILAARTSGGEFSQPVPVSGDISDS